jgi:hypothetical protein
MKELGVSSESNTAQIHCLWVHAAINGEPIRRAGFGSAPVASQIPEGKDYSVRVFRSRQEVDIYFASFKTFRR